MEKEVRSDYKRNISFYSFWKGNTAFWVIHVQASMSSTKLIQDGDGVFVTSPIIRYEKSEYCLHPVLEAPQLRSFLRKNRQITTLWTSVQMLSRIALNRRKTESAAGELDFAKCTCGFLEAKGFPSTISHTIGMNICSQDYGYTCICQKKACGQCHQTRCCKETSPECYYIHCSGVTWDNAENLCKNDSDGLAIVKSQDLIKQIEEKAFNLCQKTQRKFWINMSNCGWTYKEAFVPRDWWLPGQPRGEGECAVFLRQEDSSVGLMVQPCDSQHHLLCCNQSVTAAKATGSKNSFCQHVFPCRASRISNSPLEQKATLLNDGIL